MTSGIARNTRKTRKKEILINLLVLICAILIISIILELGLRILDKPEQIKDSKGNSPYIPDNELGYRFKLNYSGRFTGNGFNVAFQTNSLGYRDSEFSTSDKSIIFMMGDSMTMGHGVEENETLADILEKNLSDKGYKVYNFGMMHYSQKQEVKQLLEFMPVYKPKLVIVNFALENDVLDNCEPIEPINLSPDMTLRALLKKSRLLTLAYRKILLPFKQPIMLPFYINETDYTKHCYEQTENYLSDIKNVVNMYNSKLVVFVLGNGLQTIEGDADNLEKKYASQGFYLYRMDDKISEICSEFSIDCYDLTPAFIKSNKGESLYILDKVHWSLEGSELAFSEVIKYLNSRNYI